MNHNRTIMVYAGHNKTIMVHAGLSFLFMF
jgi:hypothetical protein